MVQVQPTNASRNSYWNAPCGSWGIVQVLPTKHVAPVDIGIPSVPEGFNSTRVVAIVRLDLKNPPAAAGGIEAVRES